MAAVPPNASMGLLNLGGCGVSLPSLHPNSSARHGFLVPRRGVSVSPLGWGLVRRGRILDAGFEAAGSLASGEAGPGSSELRNIEKELTFTPTFADYVKMMESVKLDRSKSLQGGRSDGRSSGRRFEGDGDASSARLEDREYPRNKSFERRKGAQRDRGGDQGRGERLAMNDSANKFTGLVGKRLVGDVKHSSDGQRKVEEYVQRRIVRGERSTIEDSTDSNDRKQFSSASYVKTKDNQGGVVLQESAGNRHAKSNSWKDLQGPATSTVSRTSVTRDSSIILKTTKSTNPRSNIHENDFKYPREGKVSSSEVIADSKFHRYQQRTENSGRNLVGGFGDNDLDHRKPTVSRRDGHTQTVPENYDHRSDSLEHGRPETIRMHRGENVQQGKFVRRDSKAIIDDRAVFNTFENGEVIADSKFHRYQQRTENSGGNLVGGFRDNDVDYHKRTVSKRDGHTQTVSGNYGHRSHSLEHGRPETIRMHRGENVQQGKFVRRDSKAVIDDRAVFNTFENGEVNADSKFHRYQQRTENSGGNLVGGFRDNDVDYPERTVSKRDGHTQTVSGNYDHRSDSMEHGRPETIRMHRRENVQQGKFVRRDSKAVTDDRAAFKTFEAFTDIRNRPRLLQNEIEERIEKLASRLNATDVNTPEWKFSKMIHDAQIKFTDHSILRIVQILGQYGNWKRVLQVVEWLQSRERFKSYKSRYIYTTVLDVLGKAKRPVEALNVFYTMLDQLSSYPDIAAYHCIAVTLGQAGLVKELFDVIDCMRSPPKKKFITGPVQNWDPQLEPDLIVYNAVLNACVQQKQWEGTFWVLQQLKEKNIRPTNTTYGLVMEVMLVCGKYNLVYEFFDRVKQKSIPGALNYKVLVNALWREGKIDEAVMAVKDMENRGIVGSASLYYDLARCLCSGGRCKEALLQVEKICKVAKKPLVVTYTGLIQTCIDSGRIENAQYIFGEMCNYCSPNNVTCNIMLKSYIDHGMFEDAKDLLENILNGRIRSKADLGQQAIADKFTFNTFLDACAEAKKWDDFEYAFRKMLSNGYHFDERRHLRMVLDAYRNGKEQLLEYIWDYLCQNGRVPPSAMIMERFCLKLRQGHTTAALSCISRFQESKIHSVSSKSWLNLLNRNADLKEESVAKLVRELNNLSRSGSSCNSLYENILSSCTEFLCGSGEKAPSNGRMPFCNS